MIVPFISPMYFPMTNCSRELTEFHDLHALLPKARRNAINKRRHKNRNRIRSGLKEFGISSIEFKGQGSYSMKTMVQHPNNRFDIDDGIYLKKEELDEFYGAEMPSRKALKLVRDAADDGTLIKKPEIKVNCVRVNYEKGYHIDIPVYRVASERSTFGIAGSPFGNLRNPFGNARFPFGYARNVFGNLGPRVELASREWCLSDAREVTDWFENKNRFLSPDCYYMGQCENGGQLRRIVRLLKKLSKCSSKRYGKLLGGFGITKLAVDCFKPCIQRDDVALYNTMAAIHNQLSFSLQVNHPISTNETITEGGQDPTARKFRERLDDVLYDLKTLQRIHCSKEEALESWDNVFNTDFFSRQYSNSEENNIGYQNYWGYYNF